MKGSIIIVSFFVLGAVLGWAGWLPDFLLEADHTRYALYLLMFLVGWGCIGLGWMVARLFVGGRSYQVCFIPAYVFSWAQHWSG